MPVRRTVHGAATPSAGLLARLVVGITLASSVLACAPVTAAPQPSGSSGPAAMPVTTGRFDRAALQTVLERRAEAVLRRDARAWATTTASQDPSGDALFARLAALPITTWRYDVLSTRRAEVGGSSGTQGEEAGVDVRLSYRLAADTRDLTRDQVLTFGAATDGTPRVLRTEPAPGAAVDPWDLGPVSVRTGARSLVVVTGDDATARDRAHDLADATDRAAQAVDGVWGTGWPRRVVVLAPASPAQAQAVLGAGRALGDLAALTVGAVSANDGRGTVPQGTADRVVLNPAQVWRLSATGRDVVLRHELTHVATRSASPWTPPLWLQEGFATWVGYSGTGVPAATVAADALPAVRRGSLPDALPDDTAFAAASGEVAAAYAASWLLCDLIAAGPADQGSGATGGDSGAALVAFYRAAAGIEPAAPSAEAALAAAFTRSGRPPDALVRLWRDRLTRLASAPG